MPTKHYLVETDKGKFMVEVDEPGEPPNINAQGGDTINGRDPNASPSLLDRFKSSAINVASHLAQPQSGMDLLGLVTGTAAPVATSAAARTGSAVESAGRGMERAGTALGNTKIGGYGLSGVGLAEAALRGDPKGLALAASPTALRIAGKGAQVAGRALQSDTPLIQFGAPAVNVERPAAAVIQAAKEAAPVAEAAAPTASKVVNVTAVPASAEKLNLSAAETKEYLRLIKSGRPPQVAGDLIKAQRAMTERLGLPSSEKVRQAVQDRNATGRWE